MARSIFSIAPTNADLTKFKAWGSTVSAQIAAMMTAVNITTSQMVWASVTPVPTTGTFWSKFEVYTFQSAGDPAQGSFPLFFKFEYGTSTIAGCMAIRLTIAKTCSSTGVLTGVLFGPKVVIEPTGADTVAKTSYISVTGSSFGLCLAVGEANYIGGILLFERAIDSSGTVNGDGLFLSYKPANLSASWDNVFIAYTAGSSNVLGVAEGLFPTPLVLTSGQSLANSGITPYFPGACLTPSGLYWIPRVALGGAMVDCSAGVVISSLLGGGDYIGVGQVGAACDQRKNTYAGMLMRWAV